ncbi:MAG TPA: HDIG domain-containing protein [Sedimentisphaerales bacterium]|jgi:putative nucleotidyltransferase with HDIG domain|nr:HDIG domain-containing protein [Sedimentisphaerales bacterium]HNU28419.1 HDIG domain-containing protein [Sedimentisphaerales bacterium]
MAFFRKTSPRRSQVRRTIGSEPSWRDGVRADAGIAISLLLWLAFVALCFTALSFGLAQQGRHRSLAALAMLNVLMAIGAAFYVCHYQPRLLRNHARALALVILMPSLLAVVKICSLSSGDALWGPSWGTGTAVLFAIILVIAYDQRFSVGLSALYCVLATLAIGPKQDQGFQLQGIGLFLTMLSGAGTCCFSLREVRTRMKLLEVSALTTVVVFVTASSVAYLNFHGEPPKATTVFQAAGFHACAAFIAGLLVQSLLPLIERVFRIATSMTLLDYSDANQPLLRKLAMEAPGTFSHSLLIGSIAEAAAEAIGCNGLLCRVGAYYHDIGKINKPKYFTENEMGSVSKHKELSPAMSQLIIVGHVKDGVEMAKEFGLPAVLRQFIESHHGTTLVEPFYHEARRKYEDQELDESGRKPIENPPSESEFRYAGPKPRAKEAAIVMLSDAVEGAVRSLSEVTLAKVEAVVHNIAMKRLQDGQFDECDLTLRELSQIEASLSKSLAAHYHGRIAYPTAPDAPPPRPERASKPGVPRMVET